jgi:hypothetical protein
MHKLPEQFFNYLREQNRHIDAHNYSKRYNSNRYAPQWRMVHLADAVAERA